MNHVAVFPAFTRKPGGIPFCELAEVFSARARIVEYLRELCRVRAGHLPMGGISVPSGLLASVVLENEVVYHFNDRDCRVLSHIETAASGTCACPQFGWDFPSAQKGDERR